MNRLTIPFALLIAAVVFTPLRVGAQSTYTTTNGTLNLVAGLTNLTSATAINPTNQSVGIDYLTDSSFSTGIVDLGRVTLGGTLAGSFGGATYSTASGNGIILIGISASGPWGPESWGESWTIRLLLADDTYSAPVTFTNYGLGELVHNPSEQIVPQVFINNDGGVATGTQTNTVYQELNIASFDTNAIGFKGIELSAMTPIYPDIYYIGVTSPVPEPSTYALLALTAAGLGAHVLRRRRK